MLCTGYVVCLKNVGSRVKRASMYNRLNNKRSHTVMQGFSRLLGEATDLADVLCDASYKIDLTLCSPSQGLQHKPMDVFTWGCSFASRVCTAVWLLPRNFLILLFVSSKFSVGIGDVLSCWGWVSVRSVCAAASIIPKRLCLVSLGTLSVAKGDDFSWRLPSFVCAGHTTARGCERCSAQCQPLQWGGGGQAGAHLQRGNETQAQCGHQSHGQASCSLPR